MVKFNDYKVFKEQVNSYRQTESQVLNYAVKDNSLYFWGLKVSSRVMDDELEKQKLTYHSQSFILGKPVNKGPILSLLPEVQNIFFLVRNPREKLYSGLLESSKFKSFVIITNDTVPKLVEGRTIEQYEDKLATYLEMTYNQIKIKGVLDGHHSRYFKSLYSMLPIFKNTNLHLINIDAPDFYLNYNILAATEYPNTAPLRPEIHTNKSGYAVVDNVLNRNKHTLWSQYWLKLAAEEEAFYKILTNRVETVSRQTFEKLIGK